MPDVYMNGHEMQKPYDSGILVKDMSLEELRGMIPELTLEERESPFARYYDMPMAPLSEAEEAAIAAPPLKPEECCPLEEIGWEILNRSDKYPGTGYGIMENGVGYAACHVYQDGLTDELVANYRDHFAVDPERRNVFYKVWHPGAHLIHFIDGVVEDFGDGFMIQEMDVDRFRFAHIGITRADIAEKDPNCCCVISFGGKATYVQEVGPEVPNGYPTCMVQYMALTDRGREMFVHFYAGMDLKPDGTVEYAPVEDREYLTNHMRGMMTHCLREYANELAHMKIFMEEGR